jgi:predicted nucleic acid-binding protein
MAAYVVDASVAIKWLIDEPGTQQAIALRRHTLSAPDLLLPECANILWKKVRRDELSGDEAVVCARLLARADVELIPARGLLDQAMRLSIRLDHPAYDCMYLGLAQAAGRPFVTADGRLLRRLAAEPATGIQVIALNEFTG